MLLYNKPAIYGPNKIFKTVHYVILKLADIQKFLQIRIVIMSTVLRKLFLIGSYLITIYLKSILPDLF